MARTNVQPAIEEAPRVALARTAVGGFARGVLGALALALFVGASAVACSSGDDGDAGVDPADAGSEPDGGRLGLCPQEPNPACMRADDCADDNTKQSNCGGCYPYNKSLCATAACTSPAVLEGGDIYNVLFIVGDALEPELKSFAGAVISSVTAGGNTITCEDVYAGRVDLNDTCYNVLDSRGFASIAQSGEAYIFTFSRFASGGRALMIVYGYSAENSAGDPIGVTCTSVDVGTPGVGRQDVPGDTMRRIQ
ncbi:hypothetical protein L6R52_13120 [Myxococcota bacterium]|nr:hypothetical protein [Myxococcota bacterium]